MSKSDMIELDNDITFPPAKVRTERDVRVDKVYDRTADKPSLSIAYVPQYLGDIRNGYKIKVSGLSGDMLYGVGFGWSTRAEAEKHSLAACGEYWRRHG